jgi:hypothetical protein
MTQTDHSALAYLARRDVSVQWRGFLRALLQTLDSRMERTERDALLRSLGGHFAATMPLPAAETLAALESRMNDALAAAAWGQVALDLDERENALRITHSGAPCVSAPEDEDGAWIGAVLEGLYSAWLGAQYPSAEEEDAPGEIEARMTGFAPGVAVLRYGV